MKNVKRLARCEKKIWTRDDEDLLAFVGIRDNCGDHECCPAGRAAVQRGGWNWHQYRNGDADYSDSRDDGIFFIGNVLVDLGILGPPWTVEQDKKGYLRKDDWKIFFDPSNGLFVGSVTLRWAFPVPLLKWGIREWIRRGRPPCP